MKEFETQDMMRQAYIDNQLSVEETIRLEGELSATDRAELEAEANFQRCLSSQLALGDNCPQQLWHDIQQRMFEESNDRQPILSPTGIIPWTRLLAMAACIGFIYVVALLVNLPVAGKSNISIFPDETVAFDVPGDSQKVVNTLTANGFFFNLDRPVPGQHHTIDLNGMRFHKIDGRTVTELSFSCCGMPVEVVVEAKNGAPSVLGKWTSAELPGTWFSAHREIDNKYRMIVIGPHLPDQVLRLFS
jgi:hypothetical protein